MVTGTTIIDHRIRAELNLSLQEYTIMDFCEKNVGKLLPEICIKEMAVEWDMIKDTFTTLYEKGFLHNFKPTEKWTNAFKADIDILWTIHAKGTKKVAATRLKTVLKKVPMSELVTKLKSYVKSNEFQYLKGLDVWLNPTAEHWNAVVTKEANQPTGILMETKVYNR